MTNRVFPPPDVYASCPQDGRILEYYVGVFDWVYVMLNPFIKPVTLSIDRFTSESYPTRREIQEGCKRVAWSEILRKTQLKNISAVDVGLRTSIGGLRKEFEDNESAKRLLDLESEDHLLLPPEGEHPDLLHDSVLKWLKEIGYDCVWVGDEFCSKRKLHLIDDLLSEHEPTIRGHANVFTPDKRLLWTVHWDSHCTFLCGTPEHPAKNSVEAKFEGFFCREGTHVYWGLHPI